ncbi:AfsR/SARP family transcriptional regulator [Streptomyces flavofungini]|uniref:Tetratricopeptide repeat protein n=1 Tax=Streptomyces flavofungini TaxID=68200 RepID=A0ABS0X1V1_9ACTN|nr:BTAD domain-containing putative transcriptional regulator [Streptomyces flavofungini]MBJ3807164.1 tetratricopeptide repeat protein [Streptomyces flavofungini]GHC74644.1 SARP family transcriptional regulator [Streptomyces flavofungini]
MSRTPGPEVEQAPKESVRIRLLGPVSVEVRGRQVGLGPQQRALLAALALARGRPVSTSRLAELLWEGEAPDGAVSALRTHVLHLRRILEPGRRATSGFEVLVSAGARSNTSYTLQVTDEQVDALRFVHLTDRARKAAADGDAGAVVAFLDEALALWTGPALEGVSDRSFALAEAERLEELRLVAREDRLDAFIELGHYEDSVAELTTLVSEFPLRERLRCQLMLALHRSGRQADALASYRDFYQLLDAEVGIEPGRPLKELHQRVLSGDPDRAPTAPAAPAARPVPRQLPPDVASFTGRSDYLRQLDTLLAQHDAGPGQTLVISSVSGMAGVGKTTLALHWMHRVADRFPDGQLYANLRGHAQEPPTTADEALGQLLRALGVGTGHLPESTDEKAALYRSLLAGRRMLILLDDAAGLAQVRPLLPGSPTCFVVVTSRNDLRGLTAFHDAHRVSLSVFGEEEALALLSRVIGADRVRHEPEAAAEAVRLCGLLPLAVRIVAAHLIGDRHPPIEEVVRRLRGADRLRELALDQEEHTGVRSVLALSYRSLPAAEQKLLRLLALAPGPGVSAPAAAALAGTDLPTTARLLDQLVARSLLESHQPGHFQLHALVGLFAQERARAEDSTAARERAVGRLLTWYLATAEQAAQLLYGTFYSWYAAEAPEPDGSPTAPLVFRTPADALAWLDDERAALLACARHAVRHGPRPFAWQSALALHGHLMEHGRRVDWLRAAQTGLRAAEAAQDEHARAVMHWSMCYVLWELARHDEALWHSAHAETLFARTGQPVETAGAVLGLAASHRERGALDQATRDAERALDLYGDGDQPAGEAWALCLLGFVRFDQGRLAVAHRHFTEGRARAEASADQHTVMLALWGLGAVEHALGAADEAQRLLTRALAADGRLLFTYAAEGALNALAVACRDAGDPRLALKYAVDALGVTHRTHRRLVEPDALNTIGTVLLRLDDAPGALDHHGRALEAARAAGCRRAEADAGVGLAAVHRHLGEYGEALACARRALGVARPAGLRLAEAEARAELALVHLALGQHPRAARAVERSVRLYRAAGHRPGLARALEVAAAVRRADPGLTPAPAPPP